MGDDETDGKTGRGNGRVVGNRRARCGLAVGLRARSKRHLRSEGLAAHLARRRPEGAVDGAGRPRLWRRGGQRRQRLRARQGRKGRRQAARLRPGQRQGTLEFCVRRARRVHVCRLENHPDGRRQPRLHQRAAGRPVRHRHEDAQTRLAQEHLEGLRRRRTAPVGHRPASADLRQPPDRGAADGTGGRGGLRQADRRGEVEVAGAIGPARLCESDDHQDRRSGPRRDDDGQCRARPHRQGRQRQRPRSGQRQGPLVVHGLAVRDPRSPTGGRRRRPHTHHGGLWRRQRHVPGQETGRWHVSA